MFFAADPPMPMTPTAAVAAPPPSPLVAQIKQHLSTVLDPELNIDIVSLGLVYDVSVSPIQSQLAQGLPAPPNSSHSPKPHLHAHILLTLTTPGCPLSAMFDGLIRTALADIPDFDADQDVSIELTFDPPWTPEMMSPEARAELGFD